MFTQHKKNTGCPRDAICSRGAARALSGVSGGDKLSGPDVNTRGRSNGYLQTPSLLCPSTVGRSKGRQFKVEEMGWQMVHDWNEARGRKGASNG